MNKKDLLAHTGYGFILSFFIVLVLLTGCNKKGGPNPPPPPPTSGAISGSAVKGVIRNAIVDLDQFGAGNALVRIGGGSTDATGAFVVSYSGYTGGPVQLTVRARKTGDPAGPATTVVCDITDGSNCGVNPATGAPYGLGAEIPAPLNFQLRTCLPEPPANGVRAPVTPFTEIVVRRAAERVATIAAEADLRTALLNAASEINQLLGGVDVLRLEAIDLSNPTAVQNATPDQLTYSALAAAVLRQSVVSGGDGSVALNNAISSLVESTKNGQIKTADLRSLTQRAQGQLLGLGRADTSGLLATLTDNANQADANTNGIFDPVPASQVEADQITRAKNLIQTVRNTVQAQKDLEAPGDIFEAEVQAANLVFEPRVNSLFDSLSLAVDTAGSFYQTQDGADGNRSLQSMDSSNVSQTATITIANSGGNSTVSVSGNVRNEKVNLSVTFTQNPETSTATTLNASIITGSIETNGTGDGARLAISKGTATLNKSNAAVIQANNDNIVDASFSLDATISQINVSSVKPISFRGQIGASAVKCIKQSCIERVANGREATFVPSHFDLTGTFANTSNSAQASVTADLANATTFDPDLDVPGGDSVTMGNVPQGTATIAFDATLAGVPSARVVISAALTDIALEKGPSSDSHGPIGTVTMTVLRGGNQVFRLQTINTAIASDSTIQTVSTVTNSTGATLTVTKKSGPESDDIIGQVAVDGILVGIVRKLSTGLIVIRYNNGTFETLFN